ncbi:MAG: magnesium transporter CorA family protein [Candidatus Limnocylindrales bacterium]
MVLLTSTSSSDRARSSGSALARRIQPTSDTAGRVRVAVLDGGSLHEAEGDAALGALPDDLARSNAIVWVDLLGPSREQVEAVGSAMGLHPLIVEDVLEGNQRAKIETTDAVVHIVLFHLAYEAEKTVLTEIDLVLGSDFLLTVHDGSWDPRVSNHLRNGLESIMATGPDHLLWAICDDIVDSYFPFADRLGDAIDEVQDAVIRKATPDTLERLFTLKRELIEIRRSAGPTREVFNQMTNREMTLVDPEELVFFRDVYDHVIRLTDEMDNYRELASSTLDVYLTQVNNNLSVIMKRLTGVTVVLAGIGAVAGVFGMSEAGAALGGAEAGGFWLVTGLILGLAVLAGVFLRKIDWI